MGQVTPTGRNRAIYNELQKFYTGRPGVIITESFLRFETILTTQQTVTFNVLTSAGAAAQTITEKRLNIPDAFIVSNFGFYLLKVATGSTNNVNMLQTFPNAISFSGASEAANLLNMYNGYMTVKINQTTWIDSLDILRFYRAGTAQKGVAVSTAASNNLYQENQFDVSDWGQNALTPGIKLDGGSNNDISITTPAPTNMAGTSSTNYAVIIARGFLIQNGSTRGMNMAQ